MTLQQVYDNQQSTATQLTTSFDSRFDDVFARIVSLAQARLGGMSVDDVLQYELIWSEILDESGYYELVSDYVNVGFDDVYGDVLKAFDVAGLSTVFTESDLDKITILKSLHSDFFVKLGNDIGSTVKKQLYNYSLADASLAQMATNIKKDIEDANLKKYATTYARTAITEYQQEVINVRSADLDGVWVYQGVVDGRTRPFCRRVMNAYKYYTTAQKNRLERDDEREFNCRHRFYLVSKEWAENEGYKKA